VVRGGHGFGRALPQIKSKVKDKRKVLRFAQDDNVSGMTNCGLSGREDFVL
jgi:hypothetical protein